MKWLETLDIQDWDEPLSQDTQHKAVTALEDGKVVYFPSLSFNLHPDERQFLTPDNVDPNSKNISYDIRNDKLGGALYTGDEADKMKSMIRRYAKSSRKFLDSLIPEYKQKIIQARTSYRPVEIQGRKAPSYRKDDTLLHVDSFPATPTKGQRILRFFTNVNPNKKPRVWLLGEPFEQVAQKFAPSISPPMMGSAYFLKLLQITKDYRTLYDHYMLNMHDQMKGDGEYQKNVQQKEVHFPAGSSWMVYTDQVSHAALSGQYVFEQTFHLPVAALKNEHSSPLRVLEKFLNKSLV